MDVSSGFNDLHLQFKQAQEQNFYLGTTADAPNVLKAVSTKVMRLGKTLIND